MWLANAGAGAATLAVPDGRYAVGVVRGEFTDASRTLEAGDLASGPRQLPALVWYPAAGKPKGDSAYLQEDAALTLEALTRNMGYAQADVQALTSTRLPVVSGAKPARTSRGFPILVFSHGYYLYPQQNSALLARLASHGYIVVSIAHPGDAADVRLQDGRVIKTAPAPKDDDPKLIEAMQTLMSSQEHAVRHAAVETFRRAAPRTRIGRSVVTWRDDTLAVAHAIQQGDAPRSLAKVLATANTARLAFIGMSFGGATSATTCKRVLACKAVVNLDGQNFDPDLYDQPVQRPLLLLLSDWPRYPLFKGQALDEAFSGNDLAYARWQDSASETDVLRVRLAGARHMGFTDLVSLLEGDKREARVGQIEGAAAESAIGDLVLAFLDTHLRDGSTSQIDRAIADHPALQRHVPAQLQQWARRAGN
ncbi:MAG: hypothetical protein ABW178_11510 [Pseudoxanthomonas sp.]